MRARLISRLDMAQPYFDDLTLLVRDIDPGSYDLTCKHFFSGAALYVDGQICASLTPKGLAFKLSESRCAELFAENAAIPMQYFDNSPVKQGYIMIPDIGNLGKGEIHDYFNECIANVTRRDA